MDSINLTQPAILAGVTYEANTVVQATPEAVQEGYAEYKRVATRNRLATAVGDSDTQQGTIGDTAQWLFVEYLRLVEAIARAKNIDEIKAFAKGRADALAETSDGVNKGTVKFPFQRKGEAKVLSEITRRATMTTAALVGEDLPVASGVVSPSTDANAGDTPKHYNSPTKDGHVTAQQATTYDTKAAPEGPIPGYNP